MYIMFESLYSELEVLIIRDMETNGYDPNYQLDIDLYWSHRL